MASTIWAQASPTGVTGYAYTAESNQTYGLYFTVAQAGTLKAVWFYSPAPAAGNSLPTEIGLYAYSGQALLTSNASVSWSGAAGSGWVRGTVPDQALAPATGYVAFYYIPATTGNNQAYLYTGASPAAWFPSVSADGNITAPQATPAGNNAPYNPSGLGFPTTYNGNSLNWLLDVEVSFAPAAAPPPPPPSLPPGRMSPAAFPFRPPPLSLPPGPAGVPDGAAALSGSGTLTAGRQVAYAAAAALSGTGSLAAARSGAHRLFAGVNGPSTASSYAGNFIAGTAFGTAGGGNWLSGYWWWVCASGQSTAAVTCALWSAAPAGQGGNGSFVVAGTTVTSGTLTAGQWNYVPLPAPVQLAPSYDPGSSVNGSAYIAAVGVNGSFPYTASQFNSGDPYAAGITSGPLVAYSGPTGSIPAPYALGQGLFTTAGSSPASSCPLSPDGGGDGAANFWVDVQVTTVPPPGYTGTYRLWPGKADSNAATVFDSSVAYNVATEVDLAAACRPVAVHYFVPNSASGTAGLATRADVWDIASQTAVATITSPSWTTESGGTVTIGSAGQWVKAAFPAGLALPAGRYRVSVYNASGGLGGWNSKDAGTGYFSTGVAAAGITWGPLTAPNQASAQTATYYPGTGTGSTGGQPVFAWTGLDDFPSVTTGLNPPQVYWVDLEVTPAVAYAPGVTLSGSGSLAAAGPVQFTSAAALAGSGSLAAAGQVSAVAGATLSGSGALAAAGQKTVPAATALSGSGALAVAGAAGLASAVTLSGSGSLTAPRSVQFTSAAPLSGSGALASAGAAGFTGSCALSGSGSLAAAAAVQVTSAAPLSGSGSLAAAALVTQPASAALAGTGTLSSAAAVQFTAGAALSGSGDLAPAGLVTQPAAASLAGSGSLATAVVVQFPASAALAGSGVLAAAGSVSGLALAAAALSGSGAIATAGVVQFTGACALSGSGALTVSALVTAPASASLSGAGLLLGAASVTAPASAALSGLGLLAATATVTAPSGTPLTGTGSITAGAVLALSAAVPLSGLGALAVTVRVILPVTEPAVAWSASPAPPRWHAVPASPRWRVVMAAFAPVSALSLECVNVTWTSSLDGTTVDPTGATPGQPALPVQFAFPQSSGNYQAPAEPVTWFTGSWLLGGTSIGYVAQCLVGPGTGVITLTAGLTYDCWSKVIGTPEVPAKFAGSLQVY